MTPEYRAKLEMVRAKVVAMIAEAEAITVIEETDDDILLGASSNYRSCARR
jgi:hypothetical protein